MELKIGRLYIAYERDFWKNLRLARTWNLKYRIVGRGRTWLFVGPFVATRRPR